MATTRLPCTFPIFLLDLLLIDLVTARAFGNDGSWPPGATPSWEPPSCDVSRPPPFSTSPFASALIDLLFQLQYESNSHQWRSFFLHLPLYHRVFLIYVFVLTLLSVFISIIRYSVLVLAFLFLPLPFYPPPPPPLRSHFLLYFSTVHLTLLVWRHGEGSGNEGNSRRQRALVISISQVRQKKKTIEPTLRLPESQDSYVYALRAGKTLKIHPTACIFHRLSSQIRLRK